MSIEKSASGTVKAPDFLASITSLLPGLAFAGALAYLSVRIEPMTTKAALATIGSKVTITAPVIALLIGMILHPVADRPTFTVGTTFAIKKILRWAIALFGLQIALADIIGLGLGTAIMVIVAMAITLASGVLFARLFCRGDLYGAIAGGATAVCGASAALATASVLPHYKGRESDTAFVAITVNILATVAMVAYPPLCDLLGFDQRTTGIFLGATIHDVAQVVGAGYMISPETGDIATYVKLLRVAMLLPVVLAISFVVAHGRGEERARVTLPLFLVGFAALVVVNSLGLLPRLAIGAINDVSRWCLVAAIAALGMKTSFKDLFAAGFRPVGLMVAETAWIGLLVLASVEIIM